MVLYKRVFFLNEFYTKIIYFWAPFSSNDDDGDDDDDDDDDDDVNL